MAGGGICGGGFRDSGGDCGGGDCGGGDCGGGECGGGSKLWEGSGSGLMTTTFWSGMISSVESRREKPSMSSRGETFSSEKNSKVLVLKARANFWNISEIWGGLAEEPSISGILVGK